MDRRDDREAFRDALLARDEAVPETAYTGYRNGLDAKLAGTSQRQPGVSGILRPRWAWLAGAAAAAVLVALHFIPFRSGSSRPDALDQELVVLNSEPERVGCQLPFHFEQAADLVAVARIGNRIERSQESLVPLHVEKVLKGASPAGSSSETPLFACRLGEPAPTDLTRLEPGAKALIYLRGSPAAGWLLLQLQPLTAREADEQLAGSQRFLEVSQACQKPDCLPEYQRCVVADPRGLDGPAYWALHGQDRPQVTAALLDHLDLVEKQLQTPQPAPDEKAAATCIELTELLAARKEPRALGPIIRCSGHLPAGQRGAAYRHLPDLCRPDDEAALAQARKVLTEAVELSDRTLADYHEAVQALGKLADSRALDVLLRELARLPVIDANVRVWQGLQFAYLNAGPKDRERIQDAWLAVADNFGSGKVPRDKPSHDLLQRVAASLQDQALTSEQQQRWTKLRQRLAEQELWFIPTR